jgi:hypothetical protein
MKLGVVGGMMASVLFAGACRQGAMNDSEAKNITGSEDGKGNWRQLDDDSSDASGASPAFRYLNPGYALISEGYFVKSANEYNQIEYKVTQYRFRIAKVEVGNAWNLATVATTPYTVEIVQACEVPKGYIPKPTRGVFVDGKLIGMGGRICEDASIGKKVCNDKKQSYVVAGCTIPKMNGKEISGQAIVLK